MSQGLKDTRELSHAALEVRVREFLQHTEVVAHELSGLPDFDLIGTLDRERRDSTALEFTVVGAQTQIIATSSDRPMDTLPVPATDEMMLQVRRGRPYVSLDTDAAGRVRDSRRGAARSERQRGLARADLAVSGAAAAQPARRHRAALLYAVCESGAAAAAAQIDLRADFDLRRADVADRGGLRRLLRRAAPGAAGPGPDRRHPRGGQGQLRHAAAAAVARRARLPGDLVQRHDQASRQGARGDSPQPAGRGGGARGAGRDPGAPVDGRGLARAGSDGAHRQSGGERASSASIWRPRSARNSTNRSATARCSRSSSPP